MSFRLSLVRHGEVHPRFQGRCYGATDVPTSARGRRQSQGLVDSLAAEGITQVFSSDLGRARSLAEGLAARCGLPVAVTAELRERDFGAWEGRLWDEIYAETGDVMERMISDPDRWRPPGGETTGEVRDRVLAWFRRLPRDGHVVAVTHGGPIAALCGTLDKRPVRQWPELVPPWGTRVLLVEPFQRELAKVGEDLPC